MSRFRKDLQRITLLREQAKSEQRSSTPARSEREHPELSEREQLEIDIANLLSDEYPEMLKSRKKQIKLNYSKTKIVKTDPQTLTHNHVFVLNSDAKITEQIEKLRYQVLEKLKDLKGNSLLITSSKYGEGKTFICTNLAVSIAQNLNRTVMLIDADLKRRSYARNNLAGIFFNSNSKAGLSDYLLEKKRFSELLINPGIPRLTIMPSGKSSADSAVILDSPKMESLIHELKSRYSKDRILIFDCSSCLPAADPLILSRLVDAVLIVVENEKTDGKALLRTIDMFEDKKIIGTVLNKTR